MKSALINLGAFSLVGIRNNRTFAVQHREVEQR